MAAWVAPAIMGGAMLGSAAIGAIGGGNDQEQSTQVNLQNPNQSEKSLGGQFGSLFQSQMTFDQFQQYFKPFLDGLATNPIKYGAGNYRLTNPQDAYEIYQAEPSKFTLWVQKEMDAQGTPLGDMPEISGPQVDIGQSVSDYQNQVQGAAKTYDQQANGILKDWLDFESQYQDIYQAIGPAYDQIGQNYTDQLASLPKFNLGLPGGGSVPLAPKQHANMYSQEAQTQAGLQSNKFGQQMQATTGQGQGIGNRQNMIGNMYGVQSDAAKSYQYPVELGQWLLQSERNLRAGQPQTQTSTSGGNSLASTLLPALAMSSPAIASAFSGNTGTQAATQTNNLWPYMNQQWGVM